MLVVFEDVLAGLCTLDPRGGFFDQKDMDDAFSLSITNAHLEQRMNELSMQESNTQSEVRGIIMYKVLFFPERLPLRDRHWAPLDRHGLL